MKIFQKNQHHSNMFLNFGPQHPAAHETLRFTNNFNTKSFFAKSLEYGLIDTDIISFDKSRDDSLAISIFHEILKEIEQRENENPNLSKSEIEKIIFNLLVNDKKWGVFIAKTNPNLILYEIISGKLNLNCFNWEIYRILVDTCNSKKDDDIKSFLKSLPKLNEVYENLVNFSKELFNQSEFSERDLVHDYFHETSIQEILKDREQFLCTQKLPKFFSIKPVYNIEEILKDREERLCNEGKSIPKK